MNLLQHTEPWWARMSVYSLQMMPSVVQAAVDSYRNDCEHPKPAYQVLNGTGAGRYDATCTAC